MVQVHPARLAEFAYADELMNEPPQVTYDTIFTTFVARTLIGEEPELSPLSAEQVGRLPGVLRGRPWTEDPVGYFEANIGPILEHIPGPSVRFATRWIETSVNRLADEMDRITDDPIPALLTDFLLIAQT